jgi:hypothetical protein
MLKPSKRAVVLAGGAVATALVLAAGAVTVASAMSLPTPSTRLLDDHGVDTRTAIPTPTASSDPVSTSSDSPDPASTAVPTPTTTASPTTGGDAGDGDGKGKDCVVTVPPAGPTVIDRRGVPVSPDDAQGVHDQGGRGGLPQGGSGSGRSGHGGAGGGSGHH